MASSLNIVYFAWVKERVGHDSESIAVPDDISTIGQLLEHLRGLGPAYLSAFESPEKLRFALDQDFAKINAPLAAAKELAIFPPVTGG